MGGWCDYVVVHVYLVSLSDYKPFQIQESIFDALISEELRVFKEPIKNQTVNVEFLDDNKDHINKNDEIIGYIEITLTSKHINSTKLLTVAKGSFITLVFLITSMILALRLSKQISHPVQTLTNTVKKISSGDYKTRINQQAQGELGILESCVNIMAKELESSRDDLESKVNESTKELNETMEELEIRNVQLDIARANAIQSNTAKSEILANMSNELRTPLGGIVGFS